MFRLGDANVESTADVRRQKIAYAAGLASGTRTYRHLHQYLVYPRHDDDGDAEIRPCRFRLGTPGSLGKV